MLYTCPWLDWHGCYDDGHRGYITDASFSHPAKAARGLLKRIFAHMEGHGWLPPRSRVLDVFGGVGTTGIEAASRGHEFVGIELEARFHALALENFQLHRRVWEQAGDTLPVMLLGDSRNAVNVLKNAGLLGDAKCQEQSATTLAPTVVEASEQSRRDAEAAEIVAHQQAEGKAKRRSTKRQNHGQATKTTTGQAAEIGGEANHGVLSSGESDKNAETSASDVELQGEYPVITKKTKTRRKACGIIPMPTSCSSATDATTSGIMTSGTGPETLQNAQQPTIFDSHESTASEQNTEKQDNEKLRHDSVKDAAHDGDSRKAVELVSGHFAACVGSPPYEETNVVDNPRGVKGGASGGIGTQYRKGNRPKGAGRNADGTYTESYGESPGQLGAMPAGNIDAAISSPPYAETPLSAQSNFQSAKCPNANPARDARDDGYSADAVVGSPPYASGVVHDGNGIDQTKLTGNKAGKNTQAKAEGYGGADGQLGNLKDSAGWSGDDYGAAPGQLGAEAGETFWLAARTILEQVHQLLRPQGVAAWIVKNYVKEKKVVDFVGNWERLCNSVGFETVCKARAWLTKTETNPGLFGTVTKTTARKSFFRRLAEAKGSPPIDFEVVLFVRKIAR